MRRALATLAALVALAASPAHSQSSSDSPGWLQGASIITGGARVTLDPLLVLEASFEQPVYRSAEGWRFGAVVSLRLTAAPDHLDAHALAGVTATLPVGAAAVQAQLLWREIWTLGSARSGGPELLVTFALGF